MKRSTCIGLIGATFLLAAPVCAWAQAPAAAPAAKPAPAADAPMVPPAGPGVFAMQKKGATGFHLVVTGHKFTSRDDAEKYLAWRAAELTMAEKGNWFTFTQNRAKTDPVPAPKRDPAAPRHSFQMQNFQPIWRYKSGDANWKTWSPYSGAAFFADGMKPEAITEFEVSADIVVRKGVMDDADPLGYEAGAVSDLLINQVSPPT